MERARRIVTDAAARERGEGETEGVGDGEEVTAGVGDGEEVTDGVGVGVLEGVRVGVAVSVTWAPTEVDAVGVAVRVVVVEGVAVSVVVVDGVAVRVAVLVALGGAPEGDGDGCVSDNTTLVSCHEAGLEVTTVAHTDMVPNPAEGAVQENVIDVLSALLLWVTWLLHDEDARELVPADRLPKNEVEVVRVLPRTTAAENPRKVPPLSVTVYVCPDSHEVTTWLDPSRTVSTNDVVDVWEVPCPGWVVQESRPAERE
jgi:hypothetical protein